MYRRAGSAQGDPHIATLDGLLYTFNGYGEYTLLTGCSFLLQARTALIMTSPAYATVFSAFAAQQTGSDAVEVHLDDSGAQLGTLVVAE